MKYFGKPPAWADRLIDALAPADFAEEIKGDLYEMYQKDRGNRGTGFANRRYLLNAAGFLVRKFFWLGKSSGNYLPDNSSGMLKSNMVVAWRNFARSKVFSFLNVFGLALGLSLSGLIYLYIQFEESYDQFHAQVGNVYRVPIRYSSVSHTSAACNPATGPAMKADFPEVESFARLACTGLLFNIFTLSHTKEDGSRLTFNEERSYMADEDFLKMFNFPAAEGNVESALAQPYSIVLTESAAKKYFGETPALGKLLRLNQKLDLTVTAILKDLPDNTHLDFDILISYPEKFAYQNWTWPEFYTYVKLTPGTDPRALEAKFPEFLLKYMGRIFEFHKISATIFLQPVTDIHLKSDFYLEQSMNGSEQIVYFFKLLAGFIIFIAWINYINLSTAKSVQRSREVGLRKVLGASKKQLVVQFFYDAFLVNFLAASLAVLLLVVGVPFFEGMIQKDILSHQSGDLTGLLVVGATVVLVGTLLVGFYPAFLLASFNPATVLKGTFSKSGAGIVLRKTLVSFQYLLSILLIAGSILIYRQLTFMQNEDLGYTKDQILALRSPSDFNPSMYIPSEGKSITYSFENEIRRLPQIRSVAASDDIPGHVMAGNNEIRRGGLGNEDNIIAFILGVEPEFFQTYDIKILAGRNFESYERFDIEKRNPIMINEVLMHDLGFKSPEEAIGQSYIGRITAGRESEGEIIGVTNNYHQESLHSEFRPMIFFYPGNDNWKYISIRTATADLSSTIGEIQEHFVEAFPDSAFDHFFLDDHFSEQYKGDRLLAGVFGVFTLIAIVISTLGLVGLTIFELHHRIREIGIRKVFGAPVASILVLFSRKAVYLMIIAYILSLPAIFFASEKWLSNFAYHVTVGWEIYLGPPLLLVMISVTTICIITIKAALTSPVEALRHE